MARRFVGNFPRTKTVYRIQWRNTEPILIEYSVASTAVSSVELVDPKGKRITVTGQTELRLFAGSVEDAVLMAFETLTEEVSRKTADTKSAILKSTRLAAMLPR